MLLRHLSEEVEKKKVQWIRPCGWEELNNGDSLIKLLLIW